MRVLALTTVPPWPPRSGYQIRCWEILRRLARRHEVTLGSLYRTAAPPAGEWREVFTRTFLTPGGASSFGSLARGPRYFVGSADLMARNLDQRVEVVVPIEDPALQERLEEALGLLLASDAHVWEHGPAGWSRLEPTEDIECQSALQERALERSRSD